MRRGATAPQFEHLNLLLDEAGGGARGRVLSRLGEYTAQIVAPLNLRPTSAVMVAADDERVEVRVSGSGSHVLVAIAAEGDLAGEVFALRMLAQREAPAPKLIAHDLSCGQIPFTWAVLGHVAGVPLAEVRDEALLRLGARQLGRALRRLHGAVAPGFGRPQTSGRWPARSWPAALGTWMARREARPRAAELLGPGVAARLWAATIEHPELACDEPRALHGAVLPERAIVTGADTSVHLEALVRPGEIVGGDPLFDLAHGLLARHPDAFRLGVYEGYTGAGELDRGQERRLARLRLLLGAVDALGRAEPAELSALRAQIGRLPAEGSATDRSAGEG